jgi:hypothetical protein
MRHEDAGLALWLASDRTSGALPGPCLELEPAATVSRVTVRQRAGAAVIALGEWLAGEPRRRPARTASRRRLAGQAS